MHGGAALTAAAKVKVRNSIANSFFMKGLQVGFKVNYYERMVVCLRSVSWVGVLTFSGFRTVGGNPATRITSIILFDIRLNSRVQ
jgi:hypothetical protein